MPEDVEPRKYETYKGSCNILSISFINLLQIYFNTNYKSYIRISAFHFISSRKNYTEI